MDYYGNDQANYTERQTSFLVTALLYMIRGLVWLLANMPFAICSYFMLHKYLLKGIDKMYVVGIGLVMTFVLVCLFRRLVCISHAFRKARSNWWLPLWMFTFLIGVVADIILIKSILTSWNMQASYAWAIASVVGFTAFKRHRL